MTIALVTGPANAGKAQVVLDRVRAHAAHGEEPLLVVPTEADQARYRRELAEGGPVFGVRVERFEGLLREVLARAGDAHASLGELARERVLARLADARPGLASALARFVAELETQRVTPARLRGALDALAVADASGERPSGAGVSGERMRGVGSSGTGSSGAERGEFGSSGDSPPSGRSTLARVCTVFEAYHEALAKLRRADTELRVTGALDALRRKPALWGGTPVLLYGFDDLTELQLDAVETLGGVAGADVTVSLAYEPGRVVFAGRAATFQRLAPLADTHTELAARAEYYAPGSREALHHLERSLLSDDATRVQPGEAVRLLEGGGPRAELELVAGEVRALLDAGVDAGEIAIVHRAPDTIAGLLGEVLDDFDIPYAMRVRTMFAHTAIGRALLGLLRCAVGDGQLGDLLAWLRAPGVLEHPELADGLEASARRRGAIDARSARALWEAERWPLDRIDRVRDAAARGTPALADALAVELQRLFGAPRRGVAAVLGADELDEARALTGGRRALEELRELARAAPELAPAPQELAGVLERLELPAGERAEADRVAVVGPLSLRARRVRMVFACGLQEGVFPAPARPHPLLGEDDRRRLALASGLVLSGEPDALAAERYLLYALASRPEQRLTLSWHTAGEDGTPLAPSLFVEDVADLFDDTLRERTVRDAARVEPVAVGAPPRPIAPLRDERVLAELRERALWSASSLETWAGCPVKWFVERLLRGQEIDPDPEPMARGALAHAALKNTLERLRNRTGSARLTGASVGEAKRLLREALAELEPHHPLSVAPERLPGARRRLVADLERYLNHAAAEASPFEPTHLELEFGFEEPSDSAATGAVMDDSPSGSVGGETSPGSVGDETPPGSVAAETPPLLPPPARGLPPLDLGEGVLLRGRIDRVDVGPGGEGVVYDYKGRSVVPGAKWAGDGAWQVALYMRAVERLLGYTPVGGFYQPLAGRDIRARGVLDAGGGAELDCVRTDRCEREELEELLEQCVAAARAAAAQARSGALEPRPDTCAYRGGCAYPTICRCER